MDSRYVSALSVGLLVVLVHACGGGGGSGDTTTDGAGGSADGGSSGSGGGDSGGSGGASGASGGSGGSEASGGSASGAGGGAGEGGSQAVTCSDDSECEGVDGVCEPVRETCVDCLFDSDCDSGYECVARLCVEVVSCSNSLDCVDVGSGAVCDTARDRCVQCLSPADCLTTADCIDNRCRPYVACDNSLDCVEGQVCDTARGRCAPCARDADCGDNRRCVDNTCRRACETDITCTPMGQLCDLSGGYCAQCLAQSDCHDAYHCRSGRCLPDVCEAGRGRCEDSGTLEVCNAAGDGYSRVYCGAQQTCVEGAEAACEDWACTPSAVECDAAAESVITCSDDGLSIVSEIDCSEDDQICYQGSCQDLECAPYSYFCLDNTRQLCSSDGLSSTLVQTCLTDEYCNQDTAQCEDLLCSPDQPACNGTLATYCNSAGDGYVAGGTDCADTEEACVSGECRECNNTVLFLGDTGTTGNDSVQTALEDAGMVVTRIDGGVTSYAGSPDASGFGVVFASVGSSYSSSMQTAGQTSIVAAHTAGTGYVTNEWASYQINSGYNTYLAPLVLLQYVGGESPTTLTLTSANHPIWDGLDNPLTLTASAGFSQNNVINEGVSIATCSTCNASTSAVAVREGEGGRVVSLAHTGNYSSAFSDLGILQLTVNAVQWAAACK